MEKNDLHGSLHDLDGSQLEGGGQILRNSVAYSALLRKGIRITNIRQGRNKPGLKAQHLKGIEEVQKLCNGDLSGAKLSSTTLTFVPGDLRPSGLDLLVNIQTAGSITLLIQTLLPVLLFQPPSASSTSSSPRSSPKPTTVTILGGTNASQAPQIDFFIHVFLRVAERMFGKDRVRPVVHKRGYYPRGGGKVSLEVTPLAPGKCLKAIDLIDLGQLSRIEGYIFVGGTVPPRIAWDMQKQAVGDLQAAEKLGMHQFPELEQDMKVVVERNAAGGGSGLVLWAETNTGCIFAGSALGDRKLKPKDVAQEATSMLLDNLSCEACVDEFLQDQLIIFMALAEGRSRILTGPISLHTQTAIWVARELTGVTFDIEELDGHRFLIQCDGIGFTVEENEWVVM